MRAISVARAWSVWVVVAGVAMAQGPPPATVSVTTAERLSLARSIELTGSVESRAASVVAAEVPGVVAALSARAGDRVTRGAPLVRLDSTDLEFRLRAAKGQLEEAQARLRLAESSFQRARDLVADQVISRQQMDDAEAEFEAWRGRAAQLEADASRLERDLRRSTVRAPFPGVVVAEHTAVGEWVDAGGPVVEMVDDTDLEVTVEVPERQFSGISVGAVTGVRFEALGGFEVSGKVRAVVPRADPQSRSFPVKVSIPNEEGRIGVGMLARVLLPVGGREEVVAVPKDAVSRQGARAWVVRVTPDSTAEQVDVTTGIAQGQWVAVSGVEVGDRVVTRGNERLFPGQPVAPQELEYPKP